MSVDEQFPPHQSPAEGQKGSLWDQGCDRCQCNGYFA